MVLSWRILSDLCPLNFKKWKKLLENFKHNLLGVVKTKFVCLDDSYGNFDKFVLTSISKKWKDYKADLKKEYLKPGASPEEVKANVIDGVPQWQWEQLVDYWFSEEGQKLSRIGKHARSMQTSLHTTGKESFACAKFRLEKERKKQVGRLEFYEYAHIHKSSGLFIDEVTSTLVQQCKSNLQQRTTENPHENPDAIEHGVYQEVICGNKPGRIRGYGLGVTPTMARLSKKGKMTEQEVERRVRSCLEEGLRKQEERMSAQMGEMLKQFQTMQSGYESQIAKLQADMNGFNSFQSFMASGAGNFTPSTSLGSGGIAPLPNTNQINFTGYGFGGCGVRQANTNFDQMTQPRGHSGGIGPSSAVANQLNFMGHGFGNASVIHMNGAPTNANQSSLQSGFTIPSANVVPSGNVVNFNGAPANANQLNFMGHGFGSAFTGYRIGGGGSSSSQNRSTDQYGNGIGSNQSGDGIRSNQSEDGTGSIQSTDG